MLLFPLAKHFAYKSPALASLIYEQILSLEQTNYKFTPLGKGSQMIAVLRYLDLKNCYYCVECLIYGGFPNMTVPIPVQDLSVDGLRT